MASRIMTLLVVASVFVADMPLAYAGMAFSGRPEPGRATSPDAGRMEAGKMMDYSDNSVGDPTYEDASLYGRPIPFDGESEMAQNANSCRAAAEQAMAMTGGEVLSVVAARNGKPVCKVTVLVINERGRPKRIKLRIPMDY